MIDVIFSYLYAHPTRTRIHPWLQRRARPLYAKLTPLFTLQMVNLVHLRGARLQLASVFAQCAAGSWLFEEEG